MFMSTTYPMFVDADDLLKQYQAMRGALARNGAKITELAALKVEFELVWRLVHMGMLVPLVTQAPVPPIPQDMPSVDNAIVAPPKKTRKTKPAATAAATATATATVPASSPNQQTFREALALAKKAGDNAPKARDNRPKAQGGLKGVTFSMVAGVSKRGNNVWTINSSHILSKADFALVNGVVVENDGKYYAGYGWTFKDGAVAQAVLDMLNA